MCKNFVNAFGLIKKVNMFLVLVQFRNAYNLQKIIFPAKNKHLKYLKV